MKLLKGKKSRFISVATTALILVAMSIPTYASDEAKAILDKIFITEAESSKALEEGILLNQQAEAFLNQEKLFESEKLLQKGITSDHSDRPSWLQLVAEFDNLKPEQKEKIKRLMEKGNMYAGNYIREIKIIEGELSANQERVKLEQVKNSISKNKNFEAIIAELDAIHGSPDFAGGSGISRNEYWLDEAGTEKITIFIEHPGIFYSKMLDEVTVEKTEKLY